MIVAELLDERSQVRSLLVTPPRDPIEQRHFPPIGESCISDTLEQSVDCWQLELGRIDCGCGNESEPNDPIAERVGEKDA